jgi:hypothetical protein
MALPAAAIRAHSAKDLQSSTHRLCVTKSYEKLCASGGVKRDIAGDTDAAAAEHEPALFSIATST